MTFGQLVDDPADFPAVAAALRAGRGPVAVDTERASGYRYDDRAFLVQLHRRDAGVFLIDPKGRRPAVTAAFADVLAELDWVVHAAPTDLPCLAQLGLHPRALFDTELAGRLAGMAKVNLAAMTEEFLGRRLAKGHGAEDWSARPLPAEWLRYAAEDVLYLLDLAEVLAEVLDAQDKLGFAEEEFAHILRRHRAPAPASGWRDVKGAGTLRGGEQLAVLRHLFEIRDSIGRRDDIAPTRILATKTMVDLSRRLPRVPAELKRIGGGHRLKGERGRFWLEQINDARRSDPDTWPEPAPRRTGRPSKSAWPEAHPASWQLYCAVRDDVAQLAQSTGIPVENLLKPELLREAAWEIAGSGTVRIPEQLRTQLRGQGAREWQIELVAPLLAARAF